MRGRAVAQKIERAEAKQLTCVTSCAYDDMICSVELDNTVAVINIPGDGRVKQFTHAELSVTNQLARTSVDPMDGFVVAGSATRAVVFFSLLTEGDVHVQSHHAAAVNTTTCAAHLIVSTDQKGQVNFWSRVSSILF
jgi:hypothetical protein